MFDMQAQRQRDWYERNREAHKAKASANRAKARDRNRAFVREYLTTHPCVDCGESDPVVLDFHHADANKEACVSTLVHKPVAISRIEAEISKCVVVCANDHRRRHAGVN